MSAPTEPAHPPHAGFDETTIGHRVRELRLNADRTLDWLADQTGFTKGYLSRIENGKKTPPIATLARIAEAFGVGLATLVRSSRDQPAAAAGDAPMYSVVRHRQRPRVVRGGTAFGYDYVSLSRPTALRRMEPFLFTFPREIDKTVFFEHEGEEFVFILTGQVEWRMGHEKLVLQAGDSVHFDARLPHRGRALKGDATALVVVYAPPPRSTAQPPR
jgi:mannose-6-phosphate isomerase-like protein (cupin superfamily)/DNA-binding XRE family transcriptional regulator